MNFLTPIAVLAARDPLAVAGLLTLALLTGCGGGPAAVAIPRFDPSAAAESAMEAYDTNQDGFVDGEELESAPGLKAALKTLDSDGDGKVSESEVYDRVQMWGQMSIGLMTFRCDVTMDGRPLEGATITFEPEEFLGGAIQPSVGVAGDSGTASPKVPKELRPTPTTPPGVQAGIYKVRISKIVDGKETIPARYNTETTLGQEVSKDDWAINNKQVVFHLKSK